MKPYARLILCTYLLLGVGAAGSAFSQQGEAVLPAKPPEALTAALSTAHKLLAEGKLQEARKELERAQTLAGGPCGECLLGIAHVQASEKQWDQALATTRAAIPLLTSSDLRALAYNQLATALVESKGSKGSAEAEEALRQAVGLGGSWGTLARYNLAEVLFKAERWAEAAEAARAYLNATTTAGSVSKKARIVLCHARLHLPEEGVEGKESDEPKTLSTGATNAVTRPEVIYQAPPVLDEGARRWKGTGSVIVKAIVDEEGCVSNPQVLKKGMPLGHSESVIEMIRRWVFKPATLEGRPVKVDYVLTVSF
jgi:TonB-like protein